MPTPTAQLVTPTYDVIRRWIERKRNEQKGWDFFDNPVPGMSIDAFLSLYRGTENWPVIDEQDWRYLVSSAKTAEENNMMADIGRLMSIVADNRATNALTVPTDEYSSWQKYREHLFEKGFSEETVGEMERSVHNVLKRISTDTVERGPVKGLVIGNVQSGKTANMAGLMAMAADHGWNMFIILSGTIENLRLQTRDRLYEDLNAKPTNNNWILLDQLSKKKTGMDACPMPHWPSNLHFEEGSRDRHYVACLKNSTRLKNLIKWLQWDPAAQRQMKVLVIDDEADQASVNTGDVERDEKERKAINRAICAMVNGMDENNANPKGQFAAMNYIGYTATPYANILNEASVESLYPRNFIQTLAVSKEYFGPQQIFGCPDTDYDGLDITRVVSKDDLDAIKKIHKYGIDPIPSSMEDALCWFLCGASYMRIMGRREPISMLVHTSQKVEHHANMYRCIKKWLDDTPHVQIIARCKRVWKAETPKMTRDIFEQSYADYTNMDGIQDLPAFEVLEEGILDILSTPAGPVKITNDDYEFRKGINMCIDNSDNNPHAGDIDQYRLIYPKKENLPEKAPVYIVVGGATLSRGLTLQGLMTTYFLRTVGQADTLMQMGRWFGYRRGYELCQRIWLTQKTYDQFCFLSELDYDLRREIQWMEQTGNTPDAYAAKLLNTPKLSFIRLSAKNKTQSMVNAEMDFSGSFNQTFIFDNDVDILTSNYQNTETFINSLGAPEDRKECNSHATGANIWRGVSLDKVKEFLTTYKFSSRSGVFSNIDPLLQWAEQITADGNLADWNIILSGKVSAPDVHFQHCGVSKVERAKLKQQDDSIINIKSIRNSRDLIVDVDLDGQPQSFLTQFNAYKGVSNMYKKLRADSGLSATPQLIIYVIDKDSKPSRSKSQSREDLNAPIDIVGLCVNIPGAQRGNSYVSKVSVMLEPDEIDVEE